MKRLDATTCEISAEELVSRDLRVGDRVPEFCDGVTSRYVARIDPSPDSAHYRLTLR